MKAKYPNYRKEGTAEVEKKLPLADRKLLEKFVVFCGTNAQDKKVNNRKAELLQVRDILEKRFSLWKEEDIDGFLHILKRDSRTPNTQKGILSTLQMFLKWNFRETWFTRFHNFETIATYRKGLSGKGRALHKQLYNKDSLPTAEEIDRMIRACLNVRDKLYISMMAEAGLPPKVITELKFSDFKIDSPEPNITTLTYYRTKNNEEFVFPFGKNVTQYLKEWKQYFSFPDRKETDYLFPTPRNRNKAIHPTNMYFVLKKASSRAGLEKNIFPYLIRHKVLSDKHRKMPEEIHRKLFGHVEGSQQTRSYSHQDDKEEVLKEALALIHDIKTITPEKKHELELRIAKLEKKYYASQKERVEDQREQIIQLKSNIENVEKRLEILMKNGKNTTTSN